MGVRGSKPKPPELKLVTGNPGHRPILGQDAEIEMREAPLEPPKKLTKVQQQHWDRFINPAWWLRDHDVPKAYTWICLWCEFLKRPSDMNSARVAQMRMHANDLGLDPGERARMGVSDGARKDPTDDYFG